MPNQRGFAHWVIVILIGVMAVGLVGAAWYYEENKEEVTTNNTSTTAITNTAVTNTNTTASTNTAVTNINSVININTVVDETDDWLTYTVENVAQEIFNGRIVNPGFNFQYPTTLQVTEDLGGIHVNKTGKCCTDPTIEMDVREWPVQSDINQACKNWNNLSTMSDYNLINETQHLIDSKDAVTLLFENQTAYFKSYYSTCIAINDTTMITIDAKPHDADFIIDYYNTIIQTISIGDYVDIRGELDESGHYTFNLENLNFTVKFPSDWKYRGTRCQDGPGCAKVKFYTLIDQPTTFTNRTMQKVKVSVYTREGNETAEQAYDRIANIYPLYLDPPTDKHLYVKDEDLYVVGQYYATNSEFQAFLNSFQIAK